MATITNFYGEIFAHPVPMELSGNACSHKCVYCFANARQGARLQDAKKVADFIKNIPKGRSWIARKILQGFPVALSNSTDPFSKSNEALTETILEYASIAKMRIFFQTKGGERAYQMIKNYGIRSAVYITITTPSDEISKRIEPGAPATSERIELIRKLTQDGHKIIVGINPMVKEWLGGEGFPQLEPFMQTLSDAGAQSFVLSPLIVRRTHEQIFAARDFAGVDVRKYDGWRAVHDKILKIHKRWGNILALQAPFTSTGWDCVEDVYEGKTLPTTQGFINYILGRYQRGGKMEVTVQDWLEYCMPKMNAYFCDGEPRLDYYIFVNSPVKWRDMGGKTIRDKEEFLRFYWDRNMPISPYYNALFGVSDKNKRILFVDDYFHGDK